MGLPSDDAVFIHKGKGPGEPYVITVNCPHKTGLGCDICRTILDFGLYICNGDISTDGRWCYIVLWVTPHSRQSALRWANLKERLLSVCPSCSISFYLIQPSSQSTSSPMYLLKFCSLDQKGLLHDVTQVLCKLELTIQRVKVTTTPDGRILDLFFFITDNLDLLHTIERQGETCKQLQDVLGESCINCELQLAVSQYDNLQSMSSISPAVAEELFRCELSEKEIRGQALSPDVTELKKSSIAYGRFSSVNNGHRELDLLVRQKGGKKIVDPEKQDTLCSRLKVEMLHPLCVIISNRGPDTELLVANPVELSGKGRPRVFSDVTYALKTLGICILSAEIGRNSTSDREWEVYRFLLDENCRFQLSNVAVRNQIVDRVRRTLMGW